MTPGFAPGWLLPFAAVFLLGAAAPAHLDFDSNPVPPLQAGCGGSLDDWETVRALDDPRDGSIRSVGGAVQSCLVVPGLVWRDGAVSVRFVPEEGTAGFALRYRSKDDYLEVGVDLRAGRAVAEQRASGRSRTLGSAAFPPQPDGWHRLTAAIAGDRLRVWVDGALVLGAGGAVVTEGRVALLARRDALVEFDDVDLFPLDDPLAPLLDPVSPDPVPAGRPFDLRLACLTLGPGDGEAPGCVFEPAEGELPSGIELRRDGHLAGAPKRPGLHPLRVRVTDGAGRAAVRSVRLRVRGVAWPRFPYDTVSRVEPSLAVVYTPDDIGPAITLEGLGRPDRLLFRLHRDHPALKVALMACPNNRYAGGGRTLGGSAAGARVWKTLATDPAFGWLELGGHGYTHAPEGDVNADHHEFAVAETGCNIDHARLGRRAYCARRMELAREAFRAAGIPDDLVTVMRFPGMQDSPEALRAASEAGFTAIFGSRHQDEAGREWWVPYPGGEILDLENSNLARCFTRSGALETALADGTLTLATLSGDPRFLAEVSRGRAYVEQIALQGGVLNLFDHWWETFRQFGDAMPRYLVLDAVLKQVEARYGAALWYPKARDLALWLEARRYAAVDWSERGDGLHLTVAAPARWSRYGLTGLESASLLVALPAGYTEVSAVRIREGDGDWRVLEPSRWWMAPGGLATSFPLSRRVEIQVLPAELPGGPGR